MDVSDAQLEPFRALHYFHENLNIHIKSSTAGIVLLADAAASSENPRLMGELITQCHPAWNAPPIHQLHVDLYKKIYCAVVCYAIVALFSALDDFLTGLEADISRSESLGIAVKRREKEMPIVEANQDADDVEPIEKTYTRYGWSVAAINPVLPVIKYFRLMRNSIAHRSSRASQSLSKHSNDQDFQRGIKGLLDHTTKSAPKFFTNEEIFVDPALAICCSDVIRTIAEDCNRRYLSMLGVKGFLLLVCHNLREPEKVFAGAYKSPEAVLNLVLSGRYRVKISDKYDAPVIFQKMGLWKDFYKNFQRNKSIWDSAGANQQRVATL